MYNSKFVFKIINQKGGEDLIESKSLTFENRFMKSTFDIDELEKPDSPFVLVRFYLVIRHKNSK